MPRRVFDAGMTGVSVVGIAQQTGDFFFSAWFSYC